MAHGAVRGVPEMEFIRTFFTLVVPAAFSMTWALGAIAGVVFWSLRYDHDAAFMSLVVPLYGAVTLALHFLR